MPFHRQNLLDDFVRRQIAFPAVEAAGAEFAAVGAADLGGNAERVPVAGVAVKRRVGRNQNAFDEANGRAAAREISAWCRGRPVCGRVPASGAKKSSASFSRSGLGRLVIASQLVTRRA